MVRNSTVGVHAYIFTSIIATTQTPFAYIRTVCISSTAGCSYDVKRRVPLSHLSFGACKRCRFREVKLVEYFLFYVIIKNWIWFRARRKNADDDVKFLRIYIFFTRQLHSTMPSSVDINTYNMVREHRQEKSLIKKSVTGRKKVFSAFLEHTRLYIPLKKNSPTVESKRVISCNRRYAEVGNRRLFS
jgi:hypothetical protein